jgi:hypothetical protein
MHLSDQGMPVFVIPNQLRFTRDVEAELERAARTYWHPQPEAPLPAQPAWIVNCCADADDFARALQILDESYPAGTPIFNHPRAVMAARRDVAGLVLKNITGLEVPRCRRFMADGPQSFADCLAAGGFRYPVVVQPTSARNGVGRLWIASQADWATALATSGGGGRWHVMSQGDDAEGPAAHAELRMVFVGRVGMVVSLRGGGMPEGSPNPAAMPSKSFLQSILLAAVARMPLDFWTLDLQVLAPDQLRLVDVSAGLPVPSRADKLPKIRAQALQVRRQLAPRFMELLGNPAHWRGDASSLPRVVDYRVRRGA